MVEAAAVVAAAAAAADADADGFFIEVLCVINKGKVSGGEG